MKRRETKTRVTHSTMYTCECCDYVSSNKYDYSKHLLTIKHRNRECATTDPDKNASSQELSRHCVCGYKCGSRTSLWRHKKKCDGTPHIDPSNFVLTPEYVLELIKNNHELQQIVMEQHQTLNHLVKNGTTNISNSNNHSHNKTFNLQFFLNETCKDAMNLMDFVESIQLQLSDIEKMGEIGYAQGISNIITTNLKALEVTQRPVHCTDKKREIMYVKESNQWDKEDANYTRLRHAIKRLANRNIKLLSCFREKYPDYNNSSSRTSDKYDHIVVEVMGGAGNNDLEKENKIIRNISKCVTLDKVDKVDKALS